MAEGHAHDHSHRAHKGRIWTYLILATSLVLVAVVANLVLSNPELATKGVDVIAGLPAWAFPTLTGAIGLLLFYIGLKIETPSRPRGRRGGRLRFAVSHGQLPSVATPGISTSTDWPEQVGAVLVAASIAGGEFLLGWQNFELGGLTVVPYAIPVVVCLILMMIANVKSR